MITKPELQELLQSTETYRVECTSSTSVPQGVPQGVPQEISMENIQVIDHIVENKHITNKKIEYHERP